MAICPYCGEDSELDLFEVWPSEHAFMLDACCEERQEELQEWIDYALALPPQERAEELKPLRHLFEGYGIAFRSLFGDYGHCGFEAGPEEAAITFAEARAFVERHHRHNRPPRGWKWGHALRNGGELIGVAIVGRPVSRMIATRDQGAVEVLRCCISPELDPGLVWNAASMLYARAAREAKRRGYSRIITYTREDEAATTLRAASWYPVARTRAESWDRTSRPRPDSDTPIRKVRWEKVLRQRATAAA